MIVCHVAGARTLVSGTHGTSQDWSNVKQGVRGSDLEKLLGVDVLLEQCACKGRGKCVRRAGFHYAHGEQAQA